MIIVASDISRVHILLGQAYHKLKRFDEALLALRCAWVLDRDDLQVGLSIARIFHAKDQKTSAVKLLTDFLDQHSHNITVLQRIAEFFYLELSEPDLAISAYWKASELAEKDRWAMLQKIGWIELERDKPAEARVALEKAIEVAPDPAFALKLLGRAYALDKDLARAEECFSRSLELDPFDVETRVELIELLELQQRFKRIVKIARAGLKQSPGDLQLSIARGKAHLELQDAETAARVFRRILRKHPQSRPAKEGLVAAQRLRKSK